MNVNDIVLIHPEIINLENFEFNKVYQLTIKITNKLCFVQSINLFQSDKEKINIESNCINVNSNELVYINLQLSVKDIYYNKYFYNKSKLFIHLYSKFFSKKILINLIYNFNEEIAKNIHLKYKKLQTTSNISKKIKKSIEVHKYSKNKDNFNCYKQISKSLDKINKNDKTFNDTNKSINEQNYKMNIDKSIKDIFNIKTKSISTNNLNKSLVEIDTYKYNYLYKNNISVNKEHSIDSNNINNNDKYNYNNKDNNKVNKKVYTKENSLIKLNSNKLFITKEELFSIKNSNIKNENLKFHNEIEKLLDNKQTLNKEKIILINRISSLEVLTTKLKNKLKSLKLKKSLNNNNNNYTKYSISKEVESTFIINNNKYKELNINDILKITYMYKPNDLLKFINCGIKEHEFNNIILNKLNETSFHNNIFYKIKLDDLIIQSKNYMINMFENINNIIKECNSKYNNLTLENNLQRIINAKDLQIKNLKNTINCSLNSFKPIVYNNDLNYIERNICFTIFNKNIATITSNSNRINNYCNNYFSIDKLTHHNVDNFIIPFDKNTNEYNYFTSLPVIYKKANIKCIKSNCNNELQTLYNILNDKDDEIIILKSQINYLQKINNRMKKLQYNNNNNNLNVNFDNNNNNNSLEIVDEITNSLGIKSSSNSNSNSNSKNNSNKSSFILSNKYNHDKLNSSYLELSNNENENINNNFSSIDYLNSNDTPNFNKDINYNT